MFLVLDKLVEIEEEMAVVPVSIVPDMFLTGSAFGTPAGSVAFEADPGFRYRIGIIALEEADITPDMRGIVRVMVEILQESIPLLQREFQMNLWKSLDVKDIVCPFKLRPGLSFRLRRDRLGLLRTAVGEKDKAKQKRYPGQPLSHQPTSL